MMSETKKFQKKKLNREDSKNIKMAAKRLKAVCGGVGAAALIVPIIQKHGKDILKVGKKMIFKG